MVLRIDIFLYTRCDQPTHPLVYIQALPSIEICCTGSFGGFLDSFIFAALGAMQIMCVKTGSDMPDIVVLTVFISNQSKEGVEFRKCLIPRKLSGALKPREKSRASKVLPEATKVRGRNAHLSLN